MWYARLVWGASALTHTRKTYSLLFKLFSFEKTDSLPQVMGYMEYMVGALELAYWAHMKNACYLDKAWPASLSLSLVTCMSKSKAEDREDEAVKNYKIL